MKKRYQKPKVRMSEVPSRRKLAAEVGALVVELAQREHALKLRNEVLAAERQNRASILEYSNDLRRENKRLEEKVEELTGDAWKQYCTVEARQWAEPIRTLHVRGGQVHVAVAIQWNPWRELSRGRAADLALLGEVKRKLLQAAGEKLEVELRRMGG